ncbi:MAG: hypothetical protein EA416_10430 [Trueperaceae bacterium]|nr:MAG: hypothetical protein EA416_10430 [Trueperaceae bacterium]
MRSLEDILDRLLAQADGGVAAALGGMDGLLVEQRPAAGPDLTTVVAELTGALADLRRAVTDALEGGPVTALDVRSEHVRALVRHVTSEHYLVLTLHPAADVALAERALGEATAAVRELLE